MPTPKNILVYRLGSLGDTIVALPCFHLIRKTYPRSKIVLLTNEPVSGKAAPAWAVLENSGLCDEVVSYPVGTRNLRALGGVRRKIQHLQPELVVHLAAARGRLKSIRDYLFFRACGVRNIIGVPWRRHDLVVQAIGDGQFEGESKRLALRLATLGNAHLDDRQSWSLNLTAEERKKASILLPANHTDLVALSMGTKLQAKDWGAENWIALLRKLSETLARSTLVLLGSADEYEQSEVIACNWTGSKVNLCGQSSPRVSAGVLERCRLFIGHDSGPLHLASAVGTPSVGIFSWHNPPGQWFPGHRSWDFIRIHYPPLPNGGWQPDLRMKRSPSEGVLLITPDDVFKSALDLWDVAKTHKTMAL